MKNFPLIPGQEILATNLEWLQTSKKEAIADRMADCFEKGIIDDLVLTPFKLTNNGDGTISVGEGVAYCDGERIEISDDSIIYNASNPSQTTSNDSLIGTPVNLSTPKSTGCKNIPIPVSSTRFIGIKYLLYCDNNNDGSGINLTNYTLHPRTNAKIFHNWEDGYEIVLASSLGNLPSDSVLLGTAVRSTGTTVVVSIVNRDVSALKTVFNSIASGIADNVVSTVKIQNSAVTLTKLNNEIKTGIGVNYGLLLQGSIIMWSGAVSTNFGADGIGLNALAGWALCDGQNGRPNLRDKFIYVAASEPGAIGGSNTQILVEANLYAHTHTMTHNHGTHDHGGSTGYVSHNHRHSATYYHSSISVSGGGTTAPRCWPSTSGYIDTDHYHVITATAISLTATYYSSSTGSNASFATVPTYYKLAFIVKL